MTFDPRAALRRKQSRPSARLKLSARARRQRRLTRVVGRSHRALAPLLLHRALQAVSWPVAAAFAAALLALRTVQRRRSAASSKRAEPEDVSGAHLRVADDSAPGDQPGTASDQGGERTEAVAGGPANEGTPPPQILPEQSSSGGTG